MPTYTQGVPIDTSVEQRVQDYNDWKARQQLMFDRYGDLINQSNAYRANQFGQYGDYEQLELGQLPELSWEDYKANRGWTEYAPYKDMFNAFSYLRDEQGNFKYGMDDPRLNIWIADANMDYTRAWNEANPEVRRQKFWDGVRQRQANEQQQGMLGGVVQPSAPTQPAAFGYSPTSNSVLNAILSSLYGNTNQQTNTANNGVGIMSNNATQYTGPFTPDEAGRAAGSRQTGGTTPLPNNPTPTRYNPYRPPPNRADGGPNDQRRTRAEQLRRSMFNGFIRG